MFSADPGHVGGFGVLVDGVGRGLIRAVACGKEFTLVATYPYEGPVIEVWSTRATALPARVVSRGTREPINPPNSPLCHHWALPNLSLNTIVEQSLTARKQYIIAPEPSYCDESLEMQCMHPWLRL